MRDSDDDADAVVVAKLPPNDESACDVTDGLDVKVALLVRDAVGVAVTDSDALRLRDRDRRLERDWLGDAETDGERERDCVTDGDLDRVADRVVDTEADALTAPLAPTLREAEALAEPVIVVEAERDNERLSLRLADALTLADDVELGVRLRHTVDVAVLVPLLAIGDLVRDVLTL